MTFAAIFLQANLPQAKAPSTQGIGGVPPLLLPDVPLWEVMAFGALNPAVIAVAFLMGRHLGRLNDQKAKLGIAAFAGAMAGFALIWVGTRLSIGFLATPARASGGIFIASVIFGIVWAAIGFAVGARERSKT